MARVVHFEITADDPERAVRFYEKALGWQIHRMEGGIAYWLVTTGEDGQMGINGAIMSRSNPAQPVINTIGVGNLEVTMEAVRNAGGSADENVDDIPNVGRFTYATDTEGNRFGILEPLPRGQ